MRWSFSEFLNLLDARSQCWGIVEIGSDDGFRMRSLIRFDVDDIPSGSTITSASRSV